MLRLLNVAILGAVVATIVVAILTRDLSWLDATLWLVLGGVALLLVNVFRAFAANGAGIQQSEPLAILNAQRDGRLAVGRLTAIRQTGTMVNHQPVCELSIAVSPEDRAAYLTTVRMVIPIIEVARWQPGAALVVIRHTLGRPQVRVVRNPPEEWRDRATSAPAHDPDPARWDAPRGVGTVLFGKAPGWLYPVAFLVGAGVTLLPLLGP